MSHVAPCRGCGCGDPCGAAAHAVVAALAAGDLDRAMDSGLLDCPTCSACSATCTDALLIARDARTAALAARDRYRVRIARLQRRATELAMKRGAVPDTGNTRTDAPTPVASRPALPAAAAMALARAKVKASERQKP